MNKLTLAQKLPRSYDAASLAGICQQIEQFANCFIQASKTYDPANLIDGAGATTTVTVPGSVMGDYVVPSFSNDLQGITLTGYISAAGTASVRFQNESGGAIDLASGTLRVLVIRR